MGLTRIRAQQISDIDYKQSVRVISKTNITLDGGAPAIVDGVTLIANNRILVAGQDSASQNGIYIVSAVGTGSNGTWIRSTDANSAGELEAGMIVTVTEGTIYKDTIWTLITNDPITIGVTDLQFQQSTGFSYGNIYANGTAILANTVGDSLSLTAGDNIAITGNATTKTITIGVTGLSVDTISNGTSNVKVVSSGGNVTIGVGGVSNVVDVGSTATSFTGNVVVSGNVSAGNVLQNGIRAYKYTAANTAPVNPVAGDNWWYVAGNVLYQYIDDGTSSQWVDVFDPAFPPSSTSATPDTLAQRDSNGSLSANVAIVTAVSATGNIIGGNVNTTGNVTAAYFKGDGSQLTGLPALYGNAQVADYLPTYTGNLNPGNLTTTGNITGSNLQVNSDAIITGNLTVNGTTVTINATTVTTNDKNIVVANNQSTSANVDGSGIDVGGGTPIATWRYNNATTSWQSNVAVTPASNAILNLGSVNNFWNTLYAVTGSISGNVIGGNLLTAGLVSATGNITGGNLSGTNIAGTLTTASQPNVTSLGTLSSLSVTGNVNGGNLLSSALVQGSTVSASGNVVSGNITTSGIVSATGNITGGNLSGTNITGTNITGTLATASQPNVTSLGTLSSLGVTGNINSGNLSTTGNVTGAYILGNGSQLTGLPATYGNTQVASYLPTYTGNLNPGNLTTTGLISATGNITGGNILGIGSGLSGINAYGNITVSGGNSTLAGNTSDTLTLVAGSGVAITANAAADSITFSVVSSTSIFATGGDMGLTTEAVTTSEDLGLITSSVSTSYDLGTIAVQGIVTNDSIVNYTITGNKLANNIAITTTGNITSGNLSATGNVTAGNLIATSNVIITNGVYYANGQPYSSGGGGADSVYMAIALG